VREAGAGGGQDQDEAVRPDAKGRIADAAGKLWPLDIRRLLAHQVDEDVTVAQPVQFGKTQASTPQVPRNSSRGSPTSGGGAAAGPIHGRRPPLAAPVIFWAGRPLYTAEARGLVLQSPASLRRPASTWGRRRQYLLRYASISH